MSSQLSNASVRLLRRVSIVCGILLLGASLLADTAGLSISSGLSRNQIGFMAAGLILIGAGISGKKFPGIYKSTGVLLLNILVALFILELVSIAAAKMIDNERFALRQRKIDDGHLAQVERTTLNGVYAPFVVWRSNPLNNCDSVSVSEAGYRNTPGNSDDPDAFTVMLLGGSSMWGTGVSDRETIAGHLQRILSDEAVEPVSVLNLGQTAFSSTQEVIELMLQVRNGNCPDMVIYFDGFNDVWGAYEAGYAGSHHSEHAIAARIEGSEPEINPLLELLKRTNTWLLVTVLRERFAPETESYTLLETYRTMAVSTDTLARSITDTYLANMGVVMALADSYDFSCLFVVQPALWYGEKQPTEYERLVLAGSNDFFLAGEDPAFSELLTATYDLLEIESAVRDNLLSYTDIFDEIEETVYSDYSGAHVYGWANAMIAERLAEDIRLREPEIFSGTFQN